MYWSNSRSVAGVPDAAAPCTCGGDALDPPLCTLRVGPCGKSSSALRGVNQHLPRNVLEVEFHALNVSGDMLPFAPAIGIRTPLINDYFEERNRECE